MTEANIKASIIADSISPAGVRLTTFELEYPRFIHAELLTHRMFSRNAASSRAIPVKSMIELVQETPAKPVHWGKNQPGMQANEELQEPNLSRVKTLWDEAKGEACRIAASMNEEGAHKQIINRILEPFQIIKVVMTTTEIDNFFHLRAHKDAQPEIKALAEVMLEAVANSDPLELGYHEWHVPYYMQGYWTDGHTHSLEEALAISASCCAQVSYRKLNKSLEKAQDIYRRLVGTKPVHASPFEHQAKPMSMACSPHEPKLWKKLGVTHMTADMQLWSGNFRGWIQHRQLIPGHVYNGEQESTA